MLKNNARLFTISLLMLFMEVFLIRWISTEVRIFAYMSNLVLLACFLGIGVGCYFSKKEAPLLATLGMLVLIAVSGKSLPFLQITDMLGSFADSVIWYQFTSGNLLLALQGTALTMYLFLMILAAFIPLGQVLGRLFDEHNNIILAYSVNIAGSLVGIWLFCLLSFYYTAPSTWFVCAIALLLFFIPRSKQNVLLAAAAAGLILLVTGAHDPGKTVIWSPYQKLEVFPTANKGVADGYFITVNSASYMSMTNLSREFVSSHPQLHYEAVLRYNQYEIPYRLKDRLDRVLIVGAGAGNDVAGALRNNARQVDAVEIDPGIYSLGRRLHPEKPFQDPRVHVIVDDARAFFKKAHAKYDVIVFGLLDSHTLSSQYNNMRLDHYVYTVQSFAEAKKLLKDDGIIVVSFAIQRDWIGARIYGMLKQVFGDVPYVFSAMLPSENLGWGSVMFITGNSIDTIKSFVTSHPELNTYMKQNASRFPGPVKLTTDDWPYLYIEAASIPRMYLLIIAALITVFMVAKRLLERTGDGGIDWHFFFLGCAFMLLEFQNVSKATLLFGSTWIASAYILSSILVLILAANACVYYVKIKKITPVYGMLLASILMLYFIPLDVFNTFGYPAKAALASCVLNLPIVFSGIIFIVSFSRAPEKDRAFGSNLMGAACGGLLESLSFITGIKALLLAVFLLYVVSYLVLPGGYKKAHSAAL